MLRRATMIMIGSLALTACGGDIGGIACTAVFVYGLNVRVEDAVSGEARAEGATMTLTSGSWQEVVETAFGATLSGAGERPGVYDIAVERDGYVRWDLGGVTVAADQCHVIPVSLTARLQPLPRSMR